MQKLLDTNELLFESVRKSNHFRFTVDTLYQFLDE